jgi:hypothetical protein
VLGDLKLPMGHHIFTKLALAVFAGIFGYEHSAGVTKPIALLNAQSLVSLRAAVRAILDHFNDSLSPNWKC